MRAPSLCVSIFVSLFALGCGSPPEAPPPIAPGGKADSASQNEVIAWVKDQTGWGSVTYTGSPPYLSVGFYAMRDQYLNFSVDGFTATPAAWVLAANGAIYESTDEQSTGGYVGIRSWPVPADGYYYLTFCNRAFGQPGGFMWDVSVHKVWDDSDYRK